MVTFTKDSSNTITQFSKQVESFYSSPHVNTNDITEEFVKFLELKRHNKVLDVGCGPGLLACYIAGAVDFVQGIDITPAMIEKAKNHANSTNTKNIKFSVGKADDLSDYYAMFDITISRLAMHHFKNPSLVIKEMAQTIKPNGYIAIFDMATSEIESDEVEHNRFEKLRDPSHRRALPLSEVQSYLGQSGFEFQKSISHYFEFDLDAYFSSAMQSPEEEQEARSLIMDSFKSKNYLGRKLLMGKDGAYKYRAHWVMTLAKKVF